MTIIAEPMPPPQSIIAALDLGAQSTMREAKKVVAPIVERETPKKTGQLALALEPRLGRVKTGRSLTVGAPRGRRHGTVTVGELVKWIEHGTGLYRTTPGPKHKIRARHPFRRMILPGGARRWTVKGQHPNPFMLRIEVSATPRVEEVCRKGAEEAAREAERVF